MLGNHDVRCSYRPVRVPGSLLFSGSGMLRTIAETSANQDHSKRNPSPNNVVLTDTSTQSRGESRIIDSAGSDSQK